MTDTGTYPGNFTSDDDKIRWLATSSDPAHRLSVADYSDLPTDLLHQLAQDPNSGVRAVVARRTDLPSNHLPALAVDPANVVRAAVAHRTDLTDDILTTLARDPYEDVRARIARHPGTPAHLIAQLATDTASDVRLGATTHPHLPAEVVPVLLTDDAANIRRVTIKTWADTVLTHDAFLGCEHDPDTAVRRQLAQVTTLPASIITALAHDPDSDVRACIAHHPHLTADAANTLIRDPSRRLQEIVIYNPTSPLPIRAKALTRRRMDTGQLTNDDLHLIAVWEGREVSMAQRAEALKLLTHARNPTVLEEYRTHPSPVVQRAVLRVLADWLA